MFRSEGSQKPQDAAFSAFLVLAVSSVKSLGGAAASKALQAPGTSWAR